MKLDRLLVTGFGKFKEQEIKLSPGLNLVYGVNESGKSTLQNFIRGMLFGFKKQGARRSYDAEAERYRPWEGSQYFGAMEYSFNGRRYRVERNFAPEEEKVRVLDGETWADLTANFSMDRRKEILFAQEKLGINPVIFDNTVCIRQLQSKNSSDLAGEIRSRLVNLSSAGEEDISVQHALAALDGELKELGITERSGKTPLGKASVKVEELERERRNTLMVYAEIQSAEANCQTQQQDLAGLEQELKRLNQSLKAGQMLEIREKLAKVDDYDRKLTQLGTEMERVKALINFPVAEKDNLLRALERERIALDSRREVEGGLAEVQGKLRPVHQALGGLANFACFEPADSLTVESLFSKLEEGATRARELELKKQDLLERRRMVEEQYARFAGCISLGPQGEAEVMQLEEELQNLKLTTWSADDQRLRLNELNLTQRIKQNTALAWGLSVFGLLMGALLGFLLKWPAALLGIPVLIYGFWLWYGVKGDKKKLAGLKSKLETAGNFTLPVEQEIEAKSRALADLLAKAGVSSPRELNEKMRQLALAEHSRQVVSLELVTVEDTLGKLQAKIRDEARYLQHQYFAPAGIPIEAGIINRTHVEEFCGSLRELQDLQNRAGELLRYQQELENKLQRVQAELSFARAEITRILTLAGVENSEQFMAACESARKLQELEHSVAGLTAARAEVLGTATREKLAQYLADLGQEILQAPQGHEPKGEQMDELRTRYADTAAKIQETKELIANLQGIIEARLTGVKNLAVVEQELLEAWQEKEQIILRKKALELARQTIVEVSGEVQREFAPLVNARIENTINKITGGRYNLIKIDEELSMKAIVPETGSVTDIGSLSLGTVDQFYFALRLALADVIGVKFPLLLDEPFIQYDDNRLEAILRVLLDLSQHSQIILFSCHRRELDTLNRIAAQRFNLIQLA
ncbi:MAG TPA: AAA family ATPase [Verrucomicrobiae bacterium]|nr:AAA family ATPase [Verrucomicrobiae bacterium]